MFNQKTRPFENGRKSKGTGENGKKKKTISHQQAATTDCLDRIVPRARTFVGAKRKTWKWRRRRFYWLIGLHLPWHRIIELNHSADLLFFSYFYSSSKTIFHPINFNDSHHCNNRNKMTKCEMIQLVIQFALWMLDADKYILRRTRAWSSATLEAHGWSSKSLSRCRRLHNCSPASPTASRSATDGRELMRFWFAFESIVAQCVTMRRRAKWIEIWKVFNLLRHKFTTKLFP